MRRPRGVTAARAAPDVTATDGVDDGVSVAGAGPEGGDVTATDVTATDGVSVAGATAEGGDVTATDGVDDVMVSVASKWYR